MDCSSINENLRVEKNSGCFIKRVRRASVGVQSCA